ncbi:probable ATP-dependent RNA helicase DDX60-like [Diceros bicornis minor]|uniref:probable ATP-dependent RNA helicase DDX60-like n=1 Tax=Diceros bicornis minor TaxID=77932 RepID=UPI0026ECA708|nr:probable ATP-dependent RNA helicase DDX60-like [Diceros bicornis minor]
MGLEDHVVFFRKMTTLILSEMPKARYSSLLNDFVESNFFVIDGDSLLVTCLCEKSFKQGQNLHLFYLVECYLVDLMSNGGQFAVVFFKEAECAYFDFPELLSLRTALILHLQHNTSIDVQTEFSRCLSLDWKLFLEERYPYFLIVSEEGLNDQQTSLFNFLIIHSWEMGVNVVLSSGQESDILRLHAYVMQSTGRNKQFSKENETVIRSAYESLVQHLEERRILALASHFGGLRWKDMMDEAYQTMSLLQHLWPEGSDIRRVVCVTSCSLSLKMYYHFLGNKKNTASGQETNIHQVSSNCLPLQEAEDLCRLHCLCLAFQLRLPLSQRACSRVIISPWIKNVCTFLKMKKWCEYFILRNLNIFECWNLNLNLLSDLCDEHLLKNIAFYYETENTQELRLNLGDFIKSDYRHLWNFVSQLVKEFDVGKPFPLRTTRTCFLSKKLLPIQEISLEKMPNLGFIPMTSAVIDKFVGDIMKDLPVLKSDDPAVTSLVKQKERDELLHWHAHRPLSNDYDKTRCLFDEKSRDPPVFNVKKNQIYPQFYGKSLESVSSKVIVAQTTQPKEDSRGANSGLLQDAKPGKVTRKKKRSLLKEDQKEQQQCNDLLFSIEKEMRENLNSGIKNVEDFLKSCKSNSVKFQVEMAGLIACFRAWKEHCQDEGKISKDLSIAVQMMKRIHSLLERYPEILEDEDHNFIAKCLKYLGFNDLANSLDPTLITGDDEKKKKKSKYSVDVGPARFQLQYMGHYLIRDERNDPDPRVQDFIPDTWQRELLDVVDNNESAVIVAPTSSGKTYASYYCMEKVLKESDEGVVVYVAPTKALVGQVAATVQNRFIKKLRPGRVLCGAFTRDYHHNTLNCQVLITEPACFEILLLTPRCQKWVKRIRYVIFDEVHCLGGEIGGKFWEHLLVMIRCPFLVLSATISNPKLLTEWLQSVKQYWRQADKMMEEKFISEIKSDQCLNFLKDNLHVDQSYEVRLVLYGERYNDLEKHVCSIKDDDICFGRFHPCAALTTDHIEKYGFSSDLTLSPQDSVQLYDTMVQVWETWPRAQELCPEEFILFKNKIVIKKLDARKYEENLKAELTNWIKNGKVKKAKRVLKKLSPNLLSSSEDMVKMFPLLVEKLGQMDKLPALFFCFKSGDVEERARSVCTFLEKSERKSCPQIDQCCSNVHDINKKLNKAENKMKKLKKTFEKDKEKAKKLEKKLTYGAEYINFLNNLKEFLKIPEDCSYADVNALHTETLEVVFKRVQLTRKGEELKSLAQRGIGYHHDSMYFKEREFVEILFVEGFIRVVTATGTLALGIHMPCKSVVFAQDSVHLNALNYRQMSGRAGRRGQDLLGDVYFFDIPLPKIKRLITSGLPELRGHFPLSITLVLRLMLLASKGGDPEDATAKVLSVLKHSLLSFKQPRAMEILKLYFLFSLQFLVKEGYLDQEGNPMRFAGLLSHLHGHEPSNFVFVHFLMKGLFHKLCQPIKKGSQQFSQDVMEKLVLVLANLFGRKYIPAKFQEANLSFPPPEVILDELPEDFKAALHEYNLKVMEDFASFLLIASKLVNMRNEYRLPLSRIKFTGKESEDSQLVSHLMNCKEGRGAISPFVCLSGNTDGDLLRPETLNGVILRTVGINGTQAPVLWSQKLDNRGRRMPLNAYALDFYKHGSLTRLGRENGMTVGQILKLLKDFALNIETISDSLSELCEDEHDNVVLAFKQLSQLFHEKLRQV